MFWNLSYTLNPLWKTCPHLPGTYRYSGTRLHTCARARSHTMADTHEGTFIDPRATPHPAPVSEIRLQIKTNLSTFPTQACGLLQPNLLARILSPPPALSPTFSSEPVHPTAPFSFITSRFHKTFVCSSEWQAEGQVGAGQEWGLGPLGRVPGSVQPGARGSSGARRRDQARAARRSAGVRASGGARPQRRRQRGGLPEPRCASRGAGRAAQSGGGQAESAHAPRRARR